MIMERNTGMERAPTDHEPPLKVGARISNPCPCCSIITGHTPATWPDTIAFTPLGSALPGHALIVPYRHI